MGLANIPDELKALDQWVCWRWEERDGRRTKVPVSARGGLASSTNPATWASFEDATVALSGGNDGVGFVFTGCDPYCGIDLDDCLDTDGGGIDADAWDTLQRFGSYYERTPSGTGIHVIVRGVLPRGGRKRGDRECYDRARFFTFTGDTFGQALPIRDAQSELEAWHAETFPAANPAAEKARREVLWDTDADLVRKVMASAGADKFRRLWDGDTTGYASGSEADLALCGILGFWCGRNAEAVDRLFRASGLMRSKWDARRGDSTYGARTVALACSSGDSYDPDYKSQPEAIIALPDVKPATATEPARKFKWASELTAPPSADDWIWNGYLPRGGITLLSALWKAGKTTLLSHLLQACGSGGSFLARELKPSRVLYVSEEGERHWVRRRDSLALADHAGFYLQPFPAKPNLASWFGFVDQLAADVEAHRFDLVVFDTLAKLWPVAEENDAGEVDAALMPLWKVTKGGAAVLLIHHLRKSGGSEYTGSRGSGALSAFPDVIVELTRFDAADHKSRKRVLRAKGRYEETPDELVIELVDGRYQALTDAEAHAARVDLKAGAEPDPAGEEARVIGFLTGTADPWSTSGEIRTGLRGGEAGGMRDTDVSAHLNSLVARELVAVRGRPRSNTNPRQFALTARLVPAHSTPETHVGQERGHEPSAHAHSSCPPASMGWSEPAGDETPDFEGEIEEVPI